MMMSNILDGLLGSVRSWRKRRERELWRNPEWAYSRIVSQIDQLDREMALTQRRGREVAQADIDLYHRLQRLEQEAYFRVYNFAQIASKLMREWECEQERLEVERETYNPAERRDKIKAIGKLQEV
jgi:hypothetical protein